MHTPTQDAPLDLPAPKCGTTQATDAMSAARLRRSIDLPLENGATPRLSTFSGLADGRDDHFSLQFGQGLRDLPPLVRLHSSCVSGDILGSQRCDCGPQLREALDQFAAHGGVLLYLMQEGRGLGFARKVEAYALQSELGLDTFEANRALGFPDDARDYRVAAQMLDALRIYTVRLLTNNPEKARQLERYGIRVTACQPTGYFPSEANRAYLCAKHAHGHRFNVEPRTARFGQEDRA